MRILTGNDLASGDVVWWTGSGWSRHIADATETGQNGEAIAAVEEAERRVNVPYLLEATPSPTGPRPVHIKDRVRALGPTVRPDLTLKPTDPAALEIA